MSDLRAHEAALVAFGRFMVNPDPDPMKVDYAEMGRLAAEVINGIPVVRAALRGSEPSPTLDVERLARAMERLDWAWLSWVDEARVGDRPRVREAFGNVTVKLAAEYALLASPSPEKEPE